MLSPKFRNLEFNDCCHLSLLQHSFIVWKIVAKTSVNLKMPLILLSRVTIRDWLCPMTSWWIASARVAFSSTYSPSVNVCMNFVTGCAPDFLQILLKSLSHRLNSAIIDSMYFFDKP